jgi:MFS family permease
VTSRVSAIRFVVWFGFVSALGDVVYEGARSVIGPFLAHLGATATVVGLITGLGEASALVLRLATGRIVDRARHPWPQTILGYAMTMVCVPLLAVAGGLWPAGLLYNGERFGKAVRSPGRDIMLAHASTSIGRGKAFGLHEAMDQFGAMLGPLLVAAVIAIGAGYRWAFAVLAIPGALALVVLGGLRRAVPRPEVYDPSLEVSAGKKMQLDVHLPRRYWNYTAFSAALMLGFATWAVLAYHLTVRHLVAPGLIPVLYAGAMLAAGATSVGSGWVYDRWGFRGLAFLPVLGVLVPVLAFSDSVAAVVVGAFVWGAALGVHESTMRAAVTDLVPPSRRGAGFGTFTAVYGVAWLIGAVGTGALYSHGQAAIVIAVAIVQVVAAILLVPLLRAPQTANA